MSTETAPESVTVDELTKALIRVEHPCGTKDECTSCRGKAITLLSHVAASREAAYAIGDLFEDAKGVQWYRTGGEMPWRHVSTGQHHYHGRPERPLRRLVPEGSPLGDDEQALIHADLSRLLDLLGLGDHARPGSPHEVFLMCIEQVKRFITPIDLRNREETGQ